MCHNDARGYAGGSGGGGGAITNDVLKKVMEFERLTSFSYIY